LLLSGLVGSSPRGPLDRSSPSPKAPGPAKLSYDDFLAFLEAYKAIRDLTPDGKPRARPLSTRRIAQQLVEQRDRPWSGLSMEAVRVEIHRLEKAAERRWVEQNEKLEQIR
jgi:hypothetical protein